jgi:hypothetical protein
LAWRSAEANTRRQSWPETRHRFSLALVWFALIRLNFGLFPLDQAVAEHHHDQYHDEKSKPAHHGIHDMVLTTMTLKTFASYDGLAIVYSLAMPQS